MCIIVKQNKLQDALSDRFQLQCSLVETREDTFWRPHKGAFLQNVTNRLQSNILSSDGSRIPKSYGLHVLPCSAPIAYVETCTSLLGRLFPPHCTHHRNVREAQREIGHFQQRIIEALISVPSTPLSTPQALQSCRLALPQTAPPLTARTPTPCISCPSLAPMLHYFHALTKPNILLVTNAIYLHKPPHLGTISRPTHTMGSVDTPSIRCTATILVMIRGLPTA